MKTFLIALALVAATCIIGLLAAQVVTALFIGESFPPVPMTTKTTYSLRVPATSPISP